MEQLVAQQVPAVRQRAQVGKRKGGSTEPKTSSDVDSGKWPTPDDRTEPPTQVAAVQYLNNPHLTLDKHLRILAIRGGKKTLWREANRRWDGGEACS
ncbi:hypothetical protein BLNAU_24724 [Blattamonas nauphoetae]|uniref:Uncharacterized protein n=1 Tax=Blattamonas nauphoetae TaxID=2049346 RepID=A0ABQ9WLN2_9EUKA|nr:hypothetical protein BLNAU_24724 [Blattamonas nauphoetae]